MRKRKEELEVKLNNLKKEAMELAKEFLREEKDDEIEMSLDVSKLSSISNAIFATGEIGEVLFSLASILKIVETVTGEEKEMKECAEALTNVIGEILKQNNVPFDVTIVKL